MNIVKLSASPSIDGACDTSHWLISSRSVQVRGRTFDIYFILGGGEGVGKGRSWKMGAP